MKRMGYSTVKESHVYTMAKVIAKFIKKKHPNVKKVFAVSQKAIRTSLEAEGIEVIGGDQVIIPHDTEIDEIMFDNYQLETDVGAVVYGSDFAFTA